MKEIDWNAPFKPEDFQKLYKTAFKEGYFSASAGDLWEPSVFAEDFAKQANARFRELLEMAPKVLGWGISQGEWHDSGQRKYFNKPATHDARLVAIKEIGK